MLGIYMQRSGVILLTACIFLLPIYIFATPVLRLLGEGETIAVHAWRFSLYTIPQLFMYGLNFPIQFLQSQSKVMAMSCITAAAVLLHILLSWLLIVWLGLGLGGASISLNVSSWFVVIAQFVYIAMGSCPGAWNPGTASAAELSFQGLGRIYQALHCFRCYEYRHFIFLIIMAGLLKNAQISVAAISICMNLHGWEIMIFIGFMLR
ncbi:hypothetical protein KSP40_PGU019979 [Platanthera guangdongensis]|uniref:Uncharacterized protein n=1 Tax=Platanthera guangdongensis TaxID=2320717 RepID=A0ABR2MKF2_9ASPA